MPDFVLNCGGKSRTTGTAGYVISDDTGKSRDMRDVLTNGQVVAYHAEYRSSKDGFEDGIGTWNSSTSTLARTTISASSNSNAAVSWGVGDKIVSVTTNVDMLTNATYLTGTVPIARLSVGTTAGTLMAGDDARAGSIDYDDMDAAAAFDGTELVALSQGGDAVAGTTQNLLGDPFLQKMGHAAVKSVRDHSDFSRIRDAFSSTNGGTLDLEPYLVTQSGTGAGVSQGAPSQFGRPAAVMTTGTDTNGYVSVQHLFGGFAFAPGTSNFDHRMQVLPANLSVTGQVYYFVTGYMLLSGSTITQGMYFAIFPDEANYKCIVKDAAGETQTDSGVAVQTSTPVVLRVWYDPAALATKFYINGTLVQTILDTTRAVDLFTVLRAGSLLFKSSGTTARTVQLRRHSINVLYEAVPYF